MRLILEKIFCMTQKECSIYDCIIKEKSISQMKDSGLLNISDRDFRCLLKAYNKHGPSGLIAKKEASQAIIDYQKKYLFHF